LRHVDPPRLVVVQELERIAQRIQTLEDAATEITLNDEGLKVCLTRPDVALFHLTQPAQYKVGECFVEMDSSAAEALLDKVISCVVPLCCVLPGRRTGTNRVGCAQDGTREAECGAEKGMRV
jgi:hypothetical protein